MKPLRIIQVISSSWWTGASEPALQLTSGLARRGHQLHFVCGRGERLEEEANLAGFPPEEGVALTRSLNPIRVLRAVFDLAALFRRVRPDIVHTHLSADHWLCLLAARLTRQPIRLVRTIHHPRVARDSFLTRLLLSRGADAVIAVNDYIRGLLSGQARIPEEKLHTVRGGVDLKRFMPSTIETRAEGREILDTPPNTLLVGIVSRLASDRGHFTLFEAFRRVAEGIPNVRLVVVGKGEFFPQLEARAAELGISDRLDFPGFREIDLVEILAALDVFVLMAPGSEGSCRAVLEAMAMGLPCVVTSRMGLGEVVRAGRTAQVVPPDSPEMLAEALKGFLLSRKRRAAF
ncbi:MAG: glycosyltransferase, partial [bacterium]|nr:glycosyltransferase [bacterium]